MTGLDSKEFARLMADLRSGSERAAADLLKHYEPEIRRDIRLRLTNPKLRRVVDSMDISQSVFGNFFVRAVHGEFELDRPEQLLRLLRKMATNKVIDRHRKETSRRLQDMIDDPVEDRNIAAQTATASSIVAGHELVNQFESKLTNDEQQIATLRRNGISWNEIAEKLGQSSDALRKRLTRACDRVLTEMGF